MRSDSAPPCPAAAATARSKKSTCTYSETSPRGFHTTEENDLMSITASWRVLPFIIHFLMMRSRTVCITVAETDRLWRRSVKCHRRVQPDNASCLRILLPQFFQKQRLPGVATKRTHMLRVPVLSAIENTHYSCTHVKSKGAIFTTHIRTS